MRESRRARRLRLVVGPRRPLELVVPPRNPRAAIDAFLAQQAGWIEEKTAWAAALAARPPRLGLDRPGVVWLGGEALPVVVRVGARARHDGVRLVVPPDGAAVERWYRRAARAALEESLARQAEPHGFRWSAVSVRDPRTRWGSCSSRGGLSFSWRLVVAPAAALDYVVAHELAHLRVRDHSRRFWSLLGEVRPGWREEHAWLREHGEELHAYDPALAVDGS